MIPKTPIDLSSGDKNARISLVKLCSFGVVAAIGVFLATFTSGIKERLFTSAVIGIVIVGFGLLLDYSQRSQMIRRHVKVLLVVGIVGNIVFHVLRMLR
jgi:hypothetical protein